MSKYVSVAISITVGPKFDHMSHFKCTVCKETRVGIALAYQSVCQKCSFRMWSKKEDGIRVYNKNTICGCMCQGIVCGKKPGSRYIQCIWCNTKVAVGCCAATGVACHRCTQKEWGTLNFTDWGAHPLKQWVRCYDGKMVVHILGYSGSVHLEDIRRISDVISFYMMEELICFVRQDSHCSRGHCFVKTKVAF